MLAGWVVVGWGLRGESVDYVIVAPCSRGAGWCSVGRAKSTLRSYLYKPHLPTELASGTLQPDEYCWFFSLPNQSRGIAVIVPQ